MLKLSLFLYTVLATIVMEIEQKTGRTKVGGTPSSLPYPTRLGMGYHTHFYSPYSYVPNQIKGSRSLPPLVWLLEMSTPKQINRNILCVVSLTCAVQKSHKTWWFGPTLYVRLYSINLCCCEYTVTYIAHLYRLFLMYTPPKVFVERNVNIVYFCLQC